MLQSGLAKYPPEILNLEVTQKCIPEQMVAIRKGLPGQIESVYEGSAKVSCACIANALKSRPEYPSIQKLLAEKKPFLEAIDKFPEPTKVIVAECSKL